MMKKLKFTPLIIAFLASFALVFSGCDDGPFEEGGEAVDDAVEDTGDAIEDATN